MVSEEEKKQEEPEINVLSVNVADLTDDEPDGDIDEPEENLTGEEDDEEEAEAAPQKAKQGGGMNDLLDDIFAEEVEENDRLRAFGDLEHLTMIEVSSEVEAVLEELRIRQGGIE
jgi:hypothetical protein